MKKITAIAIGVIIFLVGCSNSEFYSNYDKFTDAYLIATDFVNTDNDTLEALKKMDTELVITELKEMKKYMDAMSEELSSEDDNGFYFNATTYYDSLNSMLNYYQNFEKLTLDERIDAGTEVTLTKMHREDIQELKDR